MRLAYADPPYPGQAKRHYEDHPDYGGEVDHAELLRDLAAYDGWALSTSAAALPVVLSLCPPTVRVAAWHVPNSQPPGNRGSWWWSWEPLIVSAARPPAITTRDVLIAANMAGFLGSRLPGEKPPSFSAWMFALLGAVGDDTLDDMFPGSGAVGHAWDGFTRQGVLC